MALRSRLIDPQFTGPNVPSMGQMVVAGPSNSVVIDKQGMYWMAGKVSYLRLCGNGPNLNCRHSGRTQETVNLWFQNGLLRKTDSRSQVLLDHPTHTSE